MNIVRNINAKLLKWSRLYGILAPLTLGGVGGGCLLASCSDMLESDSSRQLFEPGLDQKTDSVFYAYGIMQAMQQLADQYYFQNEMRGDLVRVTDKASTHLRQLSSFTADATNKYDSVYLYYKVINNCNYYLAHRDTTLKTGAHNVVSNEYAAVASFRAWTYLQLARQYGSVPYITEPVTTIGQIKSSRCLPSDRRRAPSVCLTGRTPADRSLRSLSRPASASSR